MKILVTGGAGFIGSHLSELLISEGNQVIVLDNQSTGSARNLNLSSNLEVIEGSILDGKLVDSLMSQVAMCFHLAAALGLKNIIEHPLESLETNINGSEIVLNAATKYQVRTLLASSSEVYGKNPNQPLSEDSDRLLGSPKVARWSYSEAKAIDEFYAFQLNKQKGLPVTIANAGTDLVTTAPAPTIDPRPIRIPGNNTAPPPIDAPVSTVVFKNRSGYTLERGNLSFVKVTLGPIKTSSSMETPSHKYTPDLIVTRSPMVTSFSTKHCAQMFTFEPIFALGRITTDCQIVVPSPISDV